MKLLYVVGSAGAVFVLLTSIGASSLHAVAFILVVLIFISSIVFEEREEMPRKMLILTVGLPRSGKSTWAKQQNCVVVDPDAIRLAIHGQPYIEEAEKLVWVHTDIMIRSLFLSGYIEIILDSTSYTEKMRNKWISLEWDLYFKVFDTSKETCIERAHATDQSRLVPIIEDIAGKFEPLSDEEKRWLLPRTFI